MGSVLILYLSLAAVKLRNRSKQQIVLQTFGTQASSMPAVSRGGEGLPLAQDEPLHLEIHITPIDFL